MQDVSSDSDSSTHLGQGLSVIVPLLNEIGRLPTLIADLENLNAEQVILVDGGSHDGTASWLLEQWQGKGRVLINSDAGRARQMNAGSEVANEEMLLFLHADTTLPNGAKAEICSQTIEMPDIDKHWGRFDIEFSSDRTAMKVIAWFINWRSRLSKVATGDQAIFIHRNLFNQVGGFDDIPLMEDVAMCKKLRSIQPPNCSYMRAVTSARRWEQNGVVTTVLKMWWFRLAYFIGISPSYLATSYRNVR